VFSAFKICNPRDERGFCFSASRAVSQASLMLYHLKFIMKNRPALLAVILFLFSTFTKADGFTKLATNGFFGDWGASLNNSTDDVHFGLVITKEKSGISAYVVDGPEHFPFTSAKIENGTLTLRFEQYDGTLVARLQDGNLIGEYYRPYGKAIIHYPFRATPDVLVPNPNYDIRTARPSGTKNLEGEWLYQLTDPKGKTGESGVAVFRFVPSWITATLIPVSGDSGLLSGGSYKWRSRRGTASGAFSLTRFDGIHVMLLKGELQPDGSLKGTFESGKTGRYTFSATRKEAAKKEDQPEDPFALTKVKDPSEPFQFSAPDPRTGKPVAASDPEFKNKVVIVDIMGTWCPNCHDEEPLLVELYNRYHKEGLEIVGLAYEYTDDAARNARQIEIFRKKYDVPYPILIAGTTDDGQVQKTLPQLVNFGAFPTTIFIGRDGRVSKIHAGYTGPATGERFPAVQKELDQIVRDLVKAPATTAAR
jgi:thiol-disulfide isomerase/thioredoxin